MKRWEIRTLGGPGSGNWGHAGRPGLRGGSLPRGTGAVGDPWEYLDQQFPNARAFGAYGADPDVYSDVLIWGSEVADTWGRGLSKDETQALREYTDGDYDHINDPLRSGAEPTAEAGWNIDHIDQALERSALPEDIVSYRMLGDSFYDELSEMSPGTTFTDNGYASSTMTIDLVADEPFATIIAPKGTKAAYLGETNNRGGVGSRGDELELLFTRGTQFKLIGLDEDGKPMLEIVGQRR